MIMDYVFCSCNTGYVTCIVNSSGAFTNLVRSATSGQNVVESYRNRCMRIQLPESAAPGFWHVWVNRKPLLHRAIITSRRSFFEQSVRENMSYTFSKARPFLLHMNVIWKGRLKCIKWYRSLLTNFYGIFSRLILAVLRLEFCIFRHAKLKRSRKFPG